MSQNYTAWPTFTDVQTNLTASGIPLRSGTADAFYTKIIDSVVSDFELKTHRQFIKGSAGEERKFDGSGSYEPMTMHQHLPVMLSLALCRSTGHIAGGPTL